jgi:nucleoside-diphosphate-sugar epimerase
MVSERTAPSDLHVIFGTGPAGRAVMRELLARGKRVRMVNRSGAGELPAVVELLAGDAADRHFARQASAGATVVYQCLSPPYHRWPELFPRLQAGVLEGAAAAGAKLVALENLYMYGPTYGKPLTEKRSMTAMSRKGRVRMEMSEALLQAHAKARVRVAIGRASDFFGPGVRLSALGEQVFGAALRGQPASVLGDIDQPHTYSYISDVGRALVRLGQRDEALGAVWHLPSPPTVTTRELLEMIYAEAGQPLKVRRAGKGTVRLLGFFKPHVGELAEMMYLFEEPFVVDHAKFTAAFGDLATPLDEAVRSTVEWYRSQEAAKADERPPIEEATDVEETKGTETGKESGDSDEAAKVEATDGIEATDQKSIE